MAGIAYDETGRARAGMGMDVADYANDGVPGVVVANFSEEPISLYRWRDGAFSSEASRAGVAQPTFSTLAFGIRFLDLDLDGLQDLVIANGHIEPEVHRVFRNQSYAQSPQIFHGSAYGSFEDVSARVCRFYGDHLAALGLVDSPEASPRGLFDQAQDDVFVASTRDSATFVRIRLGRTAEVSIRILLRRP